MSIDTLAVARRLESAKLPREQAEAIAAVFHDSEAATLANLATRADLQAGLEALHRAIELVRKHARADNEPLRREMMAELKLLEQRMTIKLGMMMVGSIAIVATLTKLL